MSEILDLAKQEISDGGALAYLQLTPEDIRRIGDNALAVASRIIYDFIKKNGGRDVVWGGEINPTGGLTFDVYKPLVMWNADGKHFEDFALEPSSFTVETPDSTDPRIDRIYAKFEEDHDGLTETRHVKVLPSDASSQEADIEAIVTRRNQLTIIYLAGTAASTPTPPDLPSDGVLLYQIYVPANAVAINNASFTDERHQFRKLEEVDELLDEILAIINLLKLAKHRHPANVIDIDTAQLDDSVANLWLTAQDAFNDLSHKKGGGGSGSTGGNSRVRPEILRSDVIASHAESGTLGATGILDEGGSPAVEYAHPRQVDFNGTIRTLSQDVYDDPTLSARLFNKGTTANSKSLTTSILIANVIVEETDGGGIYQLQNTVAPVAVNKGISGNRRACPRSSTIIDILGVGSNVGADNGRWLEFNTVAGTFTPRTMTGDVPTYGIRFAVTLGNGKILLAGPASNLNRIKWYLLDAVTGVSTAIANGPGDTTVEESNGPNFSIMGDLVVGGNDGIVSLIVWALGVNTTTNVAQYEYSIASNTFTQIAVSGGGPNWDRATPRFKHVDCCVLRSGELLLVDGLQGPAHTYVFNQASKSWRELNISQPYQGTNPFVNGYLYGLSLSNVNGRVHLASGSSKIWELVVGDTAAWSQVSVPALEDSLGNSRWGAIMTGLLVSGLPMGTGYLFGGASDSAGVSLTQVWKFAAGGVVASSCGGNAGITLGDGATGATFRLPDTSSGYLPWAVGKYTMTLKGQFLQGQVKVRVSFDSHAHDYSVVPGESVDIAYSDANPVRKIEIIIRGTAANKPCISEMTETFESTSGGNNLVVRFNPPTGTNYLYCDKDTGKITLASTPQETTPSKCLLLRITRSGGSAPTVLNFINKPFIHRVIRILDADGVAQNPLCVTPSLINAKKIDSSGFYKDVTAPTAVFNSTIDTAALTSANEIAVIELEA